MIDPAISLAFALPLAALLAASAAHKLKHRRDFVGVVGNYNVLPMSMAPPAAVLVVIAELALAAGLAISATRGFAGLGAALLFAVYGAAIGFNLARGRKAIDCGCSFGASADRLTPALLYRNAGLAAAALVAAAPVSARALGPVDVASILFFCISAAALCLGAEALRVNAARFHGAEAS